MSSTHGSGSAYWIVVFITAPVATTLFFLAIVYIYCTRRSRLNWYEKALLDDDDERQCDAGTPEHAGSSNSCEYSGVSRAYSGRSRNYSGNIKRPKAIVEVIKSLKKLTTRLKSSGEKEPRDHENKTEWIVCSRKGMGSSPSSPVRDPAEETFWVPPTVLDRKRAQSLVPTTTQHDSEEGKWIVSYYCLTLCN